MSFDSTDVLKWHGKKKITEEFAFPMIFGVTSASKWKAMKQRKSSKKKKGSAGGDHVSSALSATAVIHKTGDWSGNFSYFIRGSEGESRAKVYNTVSSSLSQVYGKNYPLLIKFCKKYFTLDGVNCNFNKKSYYKNGSKRVSGNQKLPYVWEAHHIVPGDVFTQVRAGVDSAKPIFSKMQLDLLMLSDYDVNHGHNLIALPTNRMDFFQPVHDLMQHPSNHPEYTKHVVGEMKKVGKQLDKLTDKLKEPHPDVVVKIKDQISKIEDALWKLLIKLGKKCVKAVITGQKLTLSKNEANLIKSSTSDGVDYPFYALG